MDIADIEVLSIKVKEYIDMLLFVEVGSEDYNFITNELQQLPRGIGAKIIELVEMVKQADLDHEREELCTIELNYPTWQKKQAWNYAMPWRLMKRRKYQKTINKLLKELQGI